MLFRIRLKAIIIDGQDVDWKKEVKYSNLILNNKLSCNKNKLEVTDEAKMLLWMYTPIVRSMITYGTVVLHRVFLK